MNSLFQNQGPIFHHPLTKIILLPLYKKTKLLLLLMLFPTVIQAEYIVLKDNSVITAKIQKRTPGKVTLKDGSILALAEIKRIYYDSASGNTRLSISAGGNWPAESEVVVQLLAGGDEIVPFIYQNRYYELPRSQVTILKPPTEPTTHTSFIPQTLVATVAVPVANYYKTVGPGYRLGAEWFRLLPLVRFRSETTWFSPGSISGFSIGLSVGYQFLSPSGVTPGLSAYIGGTLQSFKSKKDNYFFGNGITLDTEVDWQLAQGLSLGPSLRLIWVPGNLFVKPGLTTKYRF